MLIRKTAREADLIEIRPGDKRGRESFYATRPIKLSRGEFILFDGYLLNVGASAEDYFKEFFDVKGNNIHDLVEESKSWDGCWAITYINSNGSVYCFTDPLGKKQLYYNTKGDISTQIGPLVTSSSELDPLYLGEIHKWGYNVDTLTPFKDIKRVAPNKLYVFVGGRPLNIPVEDCWDLAWYGGPKEASAFRQLVRMTVESYLQGLWNEPSIGVLLSGGIDSSIIAYELLVLKNDPDYWLHDKKLNFYTINNAEDKPFVKLFAKTFGIGVKELAYDMSTVDLKLALAINETPVDLGSMIPNQRMFRAIPDRVIFTGDGPDELFGGYRRIDEYDSQKSDVFHELSYYHLPRLEKAAFYFGKELRSPWLGYDIVRYALSLPYEKRKHKECLKEAYQYILPEEIINRPKLPLKNDELRSDPIAYRNKLVSLFSEMFKNFQNDENSKIKGC